MGVGEVPSNYKTAGTLSLIAGALNVVGGFFLSLAWLFVFPPCCLLGLIGLGFGIFQAITGYQVMQGQPVKHAQMVSIIGIVVGALNLINFGAGTIPMILEIVATVMHNDEKVKGWLEGEVAMLEGGA